MKTHTNGALLCSLVQVVRVVIVRVIPVGVLCATVVHIGHDEVLVVVLKYVAIFVVIFCIWRCTLYRVITPRKKNLFRQLYLALLASCATGTLCSHIKRIAETQAIAEKNKRILTSNGNPQIPEVNFALNKRKVKSGRLFCSSVQPS